MSLHRRVALLRKLTGNPNAYAVQANNGSYFPVREPIAPVLWDHAKHEYTVGTYINWGDRARTLVFDIDEPDEFPVAKIWQALEELGIPERSIGVEWSGNKGHHVWVVAAQFLQAHTLRRIGQAVLGLSEVNTEVFPKQDVAKDLGNLVKLPYGKHMKTGEEAVFVDGKFPQPMSVGVLNNIANELPEIRTTGGSDVPPPIECMAKIQEGVGAGSRNMALFHFCVMLRRSGAGTTAVYAAADAVNNKFDPPLGQSEVSNIVSNSANAGPICSQLPPELRCEECPVYQSKLHTKEGQVRHGSSGELAVVEIGRRRKDGSIELIHPDLEAGLVKVRR